MAAWDQVIINVVLLGYCVCVGVTSRLLKLLRDQYPGQSIVCVSVTPFAVGDGPLTHYNMLLTLEHQQLYSDLVLLMHSEHYYRSIKKERDTVSMEDISSLMSSCLVNCTKPFYDTKMQSKDCSVCQ